MTTHAYPSYLIRLTSDLGAALEGRAYDDLCSCAYALAAAGALTWDMDYEDAREILQAAYFNDDGKEGA